MYKTLIFKTFFAFYHDLAFRITVHNKTRIAANLEIRGKILPQATPHFVVAVEAKVFDSVKCFTESIAYLSTFRGARRALPCSLVFPARRRHGLAGVCVLPVPHHLLSSCRALQDVCKKDDRGSARLASWSDVVPAWYLGPAALIDDACRRRT